MAEVKRRTRTSDVPLHPSEGSSIQQVQDQKADQKNCEANDIIFSTYCFGSGKTCIEKHKGIESIRDFKSASSRASFGAILNKGFIDISIDDPVTDPDSMSSTLLKMAQAMNWKCYILENLESHHIHTFWKVPEGMHIRDGADVKVACGLVADFHHGDTYIPIRCSGADRVPIYDVKDSSGNYQEMPSALLPVFYKNDSEYEKFHIWKKAEGSRNDDLYKYIIPLMKKGHLTADQITDLYKRIINPYILAEPMEESELEDTVLKPESFTEIEKQIQDSPMDEKGKFSLSKMGDILIQNDSACMIDGEASIYEDGIYTHDQNRVMHCIRKYYRNATAKTRTDVISYIASEAPVKEKADARFICFQNGILDLDSDGSELLPFTSDMVMTNKIPWNYNPAASSVPDVDEFLDAVSCHDQRIRSLILECFGACLYGDTLLKKAFIFIGESNSGKSTLLDVLKNMIGNNNFSTVSLKQLTMPRSFFIPELKWKLTNIADDISSTDVKDTELFKEITSGNMIGAERKGSDPFKFKPYCTLVFAANNIPAMNEDSDAVLKRLILVPCDNVVKEDDIDRTLEKRLKTAGAMEYIIRMSVDALKNVLKDGKFTLPDRSHQRLMEYELHTDPVRAFKLHLADQGKGIEGMKTDEAFKEYQKFIESVTDEGDNIRLSMRSFQGTVQRMCKVFGMRVVRHHDFKTFGRK